MNTRAMTTPAFTSKSILTMFSALKNSVIDIEQIIERIDRKVTYMEKVIYDHERDSGCEQHAD